MAKYYVERVLEAISFDNGKTWTRVSMYDYSNQAENVLRTPPEVYTYEDIYYKILKEESHYEKYAFEGLAYDKIESTFFKK